MPKNHKVKISSNIKRCVHIIMWLLLAPSTMWSQLSLLLFLRLKCWEYYCLPWPQGTLVTIIPVLCYIILQPHILPHIKIPLILWKSVQIPPVCQNLPIYSSPRRSLGLWLSKALTGRSYYIHVSSLCLVFPMRLWVPCQKTVLNLILATNPEDMFNGQWMNTEVDL